jgi:hypothetical protein
VTFAGSSINSAKFNTGETMLKIQVTPNPSNTEFALNSQSSSKEKVQVIVTDIFGRKLYQTKGSANHRYTFGKQFISGIYIVQVIQGKKIRTIQVVKGN